MVSLLPINRVRSFPFDTLSEVRREMDRIFENLDRHGSELVRGPASGWVPPMDIVESDDEIRCMMEIPGVGHDDLDISVQERVLRIAGTKQSERTEGNDTAYRLFERRYGRFERFLTLPDRVDVNRIAARYDNGVLTLVLPKAEAARPRQITVEASPAMKQVEAG